MIRYHRTAQHLIGKATPGENVMRVGERSSATLDVGLSAVAVLFDSEAKRGALITVGGNTQTFKSKAEEFINSAISKLSAMGSDPKVLESVVFGSNDHAKWQITALRKMMALHKLNPELLKDCYGLNYRTVKVDFSRGEVHVTHKKEDSSSWNPASSSLSIHDDVRVFSQNAASGKVANASRFFREEKSFRGLRELVIPEFLSRAGGNGIFKMWSACCSSGEEPYSYSMYLMRLRQKFNHNFRFHIFGTDINKEMLDKAKRGVYSISSNAVRDYGAYFRAFGELNGQEATMGDELRRHVSFRPFDIRQTPRRQRFKMIVCANVFQYYNDEARKHFLQNFMACCERPGYIYVNNISRAAIEELGLKYYPNYGIAEVS